MVNAHANLLHGRVRGWCLGLVFPCTHGFEKNSVVHDAGTNSTLDSTESIVFVNLVDLIFSMAARD
jgi:hypothetical protein